MVFFMFIRACKKYRFTFALSTYGGISLIIRPNNTFENIKFNEEYFNLNQMFLKAIKEMKKYRKERGC